MVGVMAISTSGKLDQGWILEHFKIEMSYSGVDEDEAGKEGEAGNHKVSDAA
jgi:hypothetical protein